MVHDGRDPLCDHENEWTMEFPLFVGIDLVDTCGNDSVNYRGSCPALANGDQSLARARYGGRIYVRERSMVVGLKLHAPPLKCMLADTGID